MDERVITEEEVGRLVAMGACSLTEYGGLVINKPIGQICPECKQPIYYDENSDYTYCSCLKCHINWIDPEMTDDLTATYKIIMGSLNGKYLFSKDNLGGNVEKSKS